MHVACDIMDCMDSLEFHKTPDSRTELISKISAARLEHAGLQKDAWSIFKESPDIQTAIDRYFDHVCGKVETRTGQGNIEVGIEMAKMFHDAGFIDEAFEILIGTGMDDPTSLSYEADRLGETGLRKQIWALVDTWEDDLVLI